LTWIKAPRAGLAEIEADLHRHLHQENKLLFPCAIECAGRN